MYSNIQQSVQNIPQIAQPPVSPEPPKSFGWLKWVLITAAVALFSSGTTYFIVQPQQQQSPSPAEVSTKEDNLTTNWKTYTNKELGFTFKYPPVLSILEDSKGYLEKKYKTCPNCPERLRQVYSLRFLVPHETDRPDLYPPVEGINIHVINNPEGYTEQYFLENYLDVINTADFREPLFFEVDGTKGIKFAVQHQSGFRTDILVKRGTKLYYFILEPLRQVKESDLYISIYTLKFLE